MSYNDKLKLLLDDPSVHNWIKPVLIKLQDHDPVDALHDCELLLNACKARLDDITPKTFDNEQAKQFAMSDIGLTEDEADLAVHEFENLL